MALPDDAEWRLQQAVYARLTADLPSGVPVYDGDSVPGNASLPYVTIGEDRFTDTEDKTHEEFDADVTVHVWCGRKSPYIARKGAKELIGLVSRALHRSPLDAELSAQSGSTLTTPVCVREYADAFKDAEADTWHGVARFRINLSEG